MTKRELSQLRFLRREIIADEQRRKRLCMMSDVSNKDIGRIDRAIQAKRRKCSKEYCKLLRYIAQIEDSYTRQIFAWRYIDGLSWQRIAMAMGAVGDGSTERKIHDRYLVEAGR